MGTSRGDAISGYYAGFEGTSGVKSYLKDIKAQVVSGTITSANVVTAVSHQLKKIPSYVGITPSFAADQAKNFTSGAVVGVAAASAATSAVFYVIGNKVSVKYKALVII